MTISRLSKPATDQRGSSIITAVFVSFALLAMIALFFQQVVHSEHATGLDRSRTTAFHIAEAGIDEAIAQLKLSPAYAGSASGSVTAGPATLGSFTTTVVDPGPGATLDRVITSTGSLAAGTQTRTVRQAVRLIPIGGFEYAMFSDTTMDFSQNASIVGNTYSTQPVVLQNFTTITGSVTSPASVTTANNSTINGDVWSGQNVLVSTGTTVTGNVLATGSATLQSNSKVTGDVRAASITNNGTIQGQQVTSSEPAPLVRTLPGFTYSPLDYPAPLGPPVETTSAVVSACWQTGVGCPAGVSRTAMRGVYHITDGGTVTGPLQKTTLAGDLFIITNGRVNIRRDFDTVSNATYRLVIISTSSSMSPAAISWTNNVTLPPNVQTLLFTRGLVEFGQLKTFSGIVYGGRVDTDNNFSITYEPSLKSSVPGFDWGLSSAQAFEVRPMAWTECRSPTVC